MIPPAGTPLTGTWQPDGRITDPDLVDIADPRTAMLGSFQGLDASGAWTLFVGTHNGSLGETSALACLLGGLYLVVRRAAIGSARGQVLGEGPGAADAALRLPGLLAMEARIEGVSTWPFDISTFLRFSALGLLAVGSWLGGAVIERLLGLAVD